MKKKFSRIEKISTQVIQDICEQKPEVCGVKKAFQISVVEKVKMAETKLDYKKMQPNDAPCAICFTHVEEGMLHCRAS